MRIYKTLKKRKIAMLWIATGLVLATLLIFPEQCRAGAANGVFLCIQVLIPSLFPFMVLSSFIVCSGIASKVPRCIETLTRILFGLPKDCFAVIILSVLGGYPVGAKGINTLYCENKINNKQAEHMSMFCVASGPGFILTYVGCSMLGNRNIGYILLTSQVISFLILGIVARFAIKVTSDLAEERKNSSKTSTSIALISSVSEAIKSCGYMCALVVLFGALCEILLCITEDIPGLSWTVALIEITNGIKILSHGYSVLLISAMCGFGGLCVHFQIYALLGEIKISKIKFTFFRVLGALLNTIFTYILLRIFPQTEGVFSTTGKSEPAFNKGVTGCIFLIICCVAFLISIKSSNIKQHKSR